MKARKFTTVTQLHDRNNHELIEYLDLCFATYNKALRETFQVIKNSSDYQKSKYNTHLQNKYGVLKRTANSIISDAQGRLNALKELKQYEIKQLKFKISALESEVKKLSMKVESNKERLRNGDGSLSLIKHRNQKRQLVAKKDHLNTKRQKLNNLMYQIENGIYKLCFGSTYLLERDYAKFVERRDSQMNFVGAKAETACNQLFQLSYNRQNNQFNIKLRKDIGGFKKPKNKEDKYVFGKVYFNHHKDKLKAILSSHNSPLSYKVIRRNGRYYLYCTFELQRDETDIITRSNNGVVGLDFNKGFITLTETNQFGHMISTDWLPYRFKQGGKTESDLNEIISTVVKKALVLGKDIAIENLNFKTTKSKTISKKGRKYNNMLHSLAYRTFVNNMDNTCYRNRVGLIKVNPAWTSWIAKRKYCPIMKLNIHTGASFVIARRSQRYKDSV